MGDDDKTGGDKEQILRFGLKIDKLIIDHNKAQYQIKSVSEGIPLPEVVLIVEAWLEKMKDSFKQPIKDGIGFFDPNKDKKQ